jgi:hypothetical protein
MVEVEVEVVRQVLTPPKLMVSEELVEVALEEMVAAAQERNPLQALQIQGLVAEVEAGVTRARMLFVQVQLAQAEELFLSIQNQWQLFHRSRSHRRQVLIVPIPLGT